VLIVAHLCSRKEEAIPVASHARIAGTSPINAGCINGRRDSFRDEIADRQARLWVSSVRFVGMRGRGRRRSTLIGATSVTDAAEPVTRQVLAQLPVRHVTTVRQISR